MTTIQSAAVQSSTLPAVRTIDRELTVTVGKRLVTMTVEAAMVKGGKACQTELRDIAMDVAISKATHGNFKAAAQIVLFAVPAAVAEFLMPAGATWTKNDVQSLVARTLLCVPKSAKGWNSNQLRGRAMAQALTDLFGA